MSRLNRFLYIGIAALLLSATAWADAGKQVSDILNHAEAPPGVVFEIVSGNRARLDSAIPEVKEYARLLRQRFPDLAIAVVTHGKEQFALMTDKQGDHKQTHSLVQSLVRDDDIEVSVCGTYATMNDVEAKEFPDYVNVTAAGPARINDYVSLGYIKIKLAR